MIGKTLGHYKVAERVGAGGMGVVYKARGLHLDRFAALRFLPGELSRDLHAPGRLQEAERRTVSSEDGRTQGREANEMSRKQTKLLDSMSVEWALQTWKSREI